VAKKPPIDKARVLERLDRARVGQLLVRVRRWIPDADPVDGFVVARSERWVLLARVSDGIHLDGWTALRIKDIQSVGINPDPACFEVKALQARGEWPPVAVATVELTDIATVVTTAAHSAPMVVIHLEFDRPDVCWIGSVQEVVDGTLSLLEVNVAGGWARKPRQFDLGDLTRVECGDSYMEALRLVAGAPPSRSQAKARQSSAE